MTHYNLSAYYPKRGNINDVIGKLNKGDIILLGFLGSRKIRDKLTRWGIKCRLIKNLPYQCAEIVVIAIDNEQFCKKLAKQSKKHTKKL